MTVVQKEQQANRRSRMETFCDILSAIGQGAQRPTHVMYRANLSWTVLQQYLSVLIQRDLVKCDDDGGAGARLYSLTHRGFQVLKQFLTIRDGLDLQS
jgi:predicted transcriptional regulator